MYQKISKIKNCSTNTNKEIEILESTLDEDQKFQFDVMNNIKNSEKLTSHDLK